MSFPALTFWRPWPFARVLAALAKRHDPRQWAFFPELRRKRRHALRLSNEFYFAAPRGPIKPEELPADAGLIEVTPVEMHLPLAGMRRDDNATSRTTVAAPWRDTIPPTWRFLAAVARRAQREAA